MNRVDEQENLKVSESARQFIARVMTDRSDVGCLRITVEGGGCHGFKYEFSYDKSPGEDDLVYAGNGYCVAVDRLSMPLITGSSLDYVVDVGGSYLTVDNPHAISSCGCGTSFNL